MKKLITLTCGILMAATCFSSNFQARVDIFGYSSKIALKPGSGSTAYVRNPPWIKNRTKAGQMIVATISADREWRKCTISFTPAKSGRVNMFLKGLHTTDTWTIFDDIKVNGASIINGDFENGTKAWWFKKNNKIGATLTDDAKNGSSALKVSHSNFALQSFKVVAGKLVTVSYWYKAAKK